MGSFLLDKLDSGGKEWWLNVFSQWPDNKPLCCLQQIHLMSLFGRIVLQLRPVKLCFNQTGRLFSHDVVWGLTENEAEKRGVLPTFNSWWENKTMAVDLFKCIHSDNSKDNAQDEFIVTTVTRVSW